ncbi:hypothetical protein [Variovorax sp. HJSM1_2]|uniref:hypothetical protein n=1 Tax=Variovorax sp. HJSM1_2 TaxID=3366263 RepID=UPI003BD72630
MTEKRKNLASVSATASKTAKQATVYLTNFEVSSVALLATLVLGGAATLHLRARADEASSAKPNTPYVQVSGISSRSATLAFQRADNNRDGKLSREEAERLPAVAEVFQENDRNKDGYLQPEEFEQAIRQ